MTDATDREEDRALAAEYALGLLSPADQAAFAARLAHDPGLRRDYAQWAEDFASLLANTTDEPPPPAVKARLHRQLFPDESLPWWRKLGLFPALGGAIAAVALVWVVNTGLWTKAPVLSAEIAATDSSLVVLATYDAASGIMTVDRTTGAVLPGRVQELWLIAGDAPPVSLGLLAQTGAAQLAVPADLAALLPGATLAISDEPPGGSPTGQPTGAVLAVGSVAA